MTGPGEVSVVRWMWWRLRLSGSHETRTRGGLLQFWASTACIGYPWLSVELSLHSHRSLSERLRFGLLWTGIRGLPPPPPQQYLELAETSSKPGKYKESTIRQRPKSASRRRQRWYYGLICYMLVYSFVALYHDTALGHNQMWGLLEWTPEI